MESKLAGIEIFKIQWAIRDHIITTNQLSNPFQHRGDDLD